MPVEPMSAVVWHTKKKAEKEQQDPENAARLPLCSEIYNTPDVSVRRGIRECVLTLGKVRKK